MRLVTSSVTHFPHRARSLYDYSARDDSIAVNSYTTVLGRAAVPEEKFRDYWRNVHGPLCSRIPGLGYYVQHHFARQRDAHGWPRIDGVGPVPGYVLDGAVEIGWANLEEQQRFQQASPLLFSDEQNVFEETAAYALPDGSTTLIDRSPDDTPNGLLAYDATHVHFSPREGEARNLLNLLTQLFDGLATQSEELIKVRLHGPDAHDNTTENPPAPNVQHTVSDERVQLVIAEVVCTDPLARRRLHAAPDFTKTLSAQAQLISHLTTFPVSGVHTFVRDSEMTTAGLRGSRTAELISDLGAANQVSEDVVTAFRR